MTNITSPAHQKSARKLKQLVSRYQHSRDLISVGAYTPGTDPVLDEAVAHHQKIEQFLQQDIQERSPITESLGQLTTLF